MVIRSSNNDTLSIKSVSNDLCQDDDPRIFLWVKICNELARLFDANFHFKIQVFHV